MHQPVNGGGDEASSSNATPLGPHFGAGAARETMCYGALDLYDADVLREYVSELRSLARAGGNRPFPFNFITAANALGLAVGHAYFGAEREGIDGHLQAAGWASCRAASDRGAGPRSVQLYCECLKAQSRARAQLFRRARELSEEQSRETEQLMHELQDTAAQHQATVKRTLYEMLLRQGPAAPPPPAAGAVPPPEPFLPDPVTGAGLDALPQPPWPGLEAGLPPASCWPAPAPTVPLPPPAFP
eukprot:EG_transcript_26339